MIDLYCYYAATIEEFLHTDKEEIQKILCKHDAEATENQIKSWSHELTTLQNQLNGIPLECYILLEYKIPGASSRPDIILLANSKVIVLEYKDYYFNKYPELENDNKEQILSYESKLRSYHKFFTGYDTKPDLYTYILRPASPSCIRDLKTPQKTIECSKLKEELKKLKLERPLKIMLDRFLLESYKPSASIMELTKVICKDPQAIPQIRQANAELEPTLKLIDQITEDTLNNNEHALIILKGIPGAGKSCIGLLETMSRIEYATTISGNASLVSVIKQILKNAGLPESDHVISLIRFFENDENRYFLCFDEAQRIWKREDTKDSEAKEIIDIGASHDKYVILLLDGEGQSINTGEAADMSIWTDAAKNSDVSWKIYSPKDYVQLNLTKSLRSKNSQYYHEWVNAVINGDKAKANELATKYNIFKTFDLKLTQEQDTIRPYINEKYKNRQYGVLCKRNKFCDKNNIIQELEFKDSKGKPITRLSNKKMKEVVSWFLSDYTATKSSNQLNVAVTELQIQGLEIDFPILEWDYQLTEKRLRYMSYHLDDTDTEDYTYLRNSYRVLLTRGRLGMIIFVPPGHKHSQAIYDYLKGCGCPELQEV